ncbi:actin cytoskeleton-regulatory complex protein sla1 [Colletotrichum spaethianum]|uniref:Actin cytoskeleton-regulatory complex protein SLA1 n=1 Tax=Colletotrichum spaethianum TaxID=700344 RepID=A0AA37L0X6_9PEZI|nr:actin cytoskeleton-regulatory complex protein sla1 [Colletotrichum spaethianum]GKT39941.1 actin cytoskeleton-regulatory complex protein sla1 [Colletotrichum spaethianum]
MGFLGVYKAVYDYVPQAEGELAINDGDVLYVLEKNAEDDWWKAKKKASADDEEEPEGLVPNNYVEEAQPVAKARALFEYTRQTDEELSFPEDAVLDVYDTSDPDWILVGLDGDFGFVPANYIEMSEAEQPEALPSPPPMLPSRTASAATDADSYSERPESTYSPASSQANNPAAALAGVMAGRSAPPPRAATPPLSPQSPASELSDDEPVKSPALPARPTSQAAPARIQSQRSIDTHLYDTPEVIEEPPYRAPGGFHMYNINEMVSVMGKRKKMPTTLGINLATGNILIAPERASDGPSQEWTAEKMTHYSREGKHVFLELVRPSKSVDFHAGAKDTAEEIVGALGELAGAVKAEGLREVILAGSGKTQKKGQVLYDFMAQGDDEVTVAVGDDVIIIDDSKSEEWWQVRRVKNGKEGVVPSSYIEVTGSIAPPSSNTGLNAARSTVEQNRLEEIRLTKEAVKAAQRDSSQQVGPGMPLPKRGSSLMARENGNNYGQRSKRENGRSEGGSQGRSGKSKPDPAKVRTWTDRSKSFSVDAQFLGLKDGKINLHKMNGVKIAVPVAKMSVEDLEYVERVTGISLDEDKPLSNVKKTRASQTGAARDSPPAGLGASVGQPQKPEYDWFQFFLSCDVAVGLCERYAQAFTKDSMDESVLPDVDASVLRNLGLREGDVLKVMRTLDQKFGRTKNGADKANGEGDGASGGLFSGPGGALRNNTRKGRPAPAVQTSDVVDPKAFAAKGAGSSEDADSTPASASATPATAKTPSGFDDDAWDVKPSKQPQEPPRPAAPPTPAPVQHPAQPAEQPAPAAQVPALTGSMQDLSLLTKPLEPQRTAQPTGPSPAVSQPPAPAQAPQPTGATPSFFDTIRPNPTGMQTPQQTIQRQRPAPPLTTTSPGSLMPPPPARPLSAPQSAQPSAFAPPPLMPQMTGISPQAFQTQVAPPGQSLNDINQARLHQQYTMQQQMSQQQMPQQQMNPYPIPQQQPVPEVMGFNPGMQQTANAANDDGCAFSKSFRGPQRQSQFSPMQAQPTGFQLGAMQGFNAQRTGSINSFLPPAMEPQRTGLPGFQPQQTGMSGFNSMGGTGPVQPAVQPLQPQKTGPPPPVRFGVTGDAKKLMPQATGRRANLSQASKSTMPRTPWLRYPRGLG